MYESLFDALRRGDAAAALTAAREAVAAQPQDPTAHRLLGSALRLAGDTTAALAALDAALALAPDDADLHLERAGLLLANRQLDDAQASLARSIGLDPNQFPAYIMQAHLAVARGDLDDAQRLTRTAARIAPDHPQIAALEGTLALRGGRAEEALKLLSGAAQRNPDEPSLRHALALAYLANGHLAFAEQAFRRLLETQPGSVPLRALIAQLVARQGRPAEAAEVLVPMLEEAGSPGLLRLIGELELQAGRNEQALPRLRTAFETLRDRRTLSALIEAWQRLGAIDEARTVLDATLAELPRQPDLWRARLLFEPFAGGGAQAVIERWLEAMPDFVPALEAQVTVHDASGEHGQAEALALRITELEPGHTNAELRVINGLLQRDPDAAIARVHSLIEQAQSDEARRSLRQLLGRTLDIAGRVEAAVQAWAEVQADVASQRLPRPEPTATLPDLPPLTPLPTPTPAVLLLWGAPGSMVERIAGAFELTGAPLRADRFGPQPPHDPLQRYPTPAALLEGSLDGAELVAQWRAQLPQRGVQNGNVCDWLLWWDNALLLALRPHLPEAVLMVALRDPRDMLLDWLAYGAPIPLALESPEAGARWMADVLAQVAELHERDLFPHRLVRLDGIEDDAAAIARAAGDALGLQLPELPPRALGTPRMPAGQWRRFAGPLQAAFAQLAPVAQRLGYPLD